MSRRSKEGDVLREMTATLNRTITDQSDPVWFGDAVSSAGFISQQATMDITSTGTISEYDKVRRIASAVVSHITCQRSPEMVSQKFDQFVLLVHHQLKLDDLARKLVGKMCEFIASRNGIVDASHFPSLAKKIFPAKGWTTRGGGGGGGGDRKPKSKAKKLIP